MSESQPSNEMKKLVFFLVGLAIAGTIVALAVYFTIELPAQMAAGLIAPHNDCYINWMGQGFCDEYPGLVL